MTVTVEIIIGPVTPLSRIATHLPGGDALINAYLVNWGQHILPRAPWRFYEAPIFYPQKTAGAFSSANPVLSLLSAPLRIFGNPVLSYNLAMRLAVWLTALSCYCLAYFWTRHRIAAAFAGVVFAANASMIWHFAGHPNIVSPFFLPGVVGFVAAFGSDPRPRWAAFASTCLLGQFLCDWYLGFIAATAFVVCAAMQLIERRFKLRKSDAYLAIGFIVTLGAAYMASSPYRKVGDRLGQVRSLGDMVAGSADPLEYIFPPRAGERTMTWPARIAAGVVPKHQPRGEDTQFLGYLPFALSIVACFLWRRRKPLDHSIQNRSPDFSHIALLFALLATGFVLSLGPYLWIGPQLTPIPLPFRAIYEWLPPIRFMRAVTRFSVLVSLGVSVLAGIAIARLKWPLRLPKLTRPLLVAGAFGILVIEFRPVSPLPLIAYDFEPEQALDAHPEFAVVGSLPVENPSFLMATTGAFPSTPSGYVGGLQNLHFHLIQPILETFPSPTSLNAFRALGTQAIVIEGKDYLAKARSCADLIPLEQFSHNSGGLFRLDYPKDLKQIEESSARIAALPERPKPTIIGAFPDSPTLLRLSPSGQSNGLWKDFTYRFPFEQLYVDVDFNAHDASRVVIELAVKDLGVDAGPILLAWSYDGKNWSRENSAIGFTIPDGKMHIIEIPLPHERLAKTTAPVRRLTLAFSQAPYPGQRVRVRDLRFVAK